MGCLDSNPRSIAAILLALGIFGIGVVLTFGFFNNSTLLGVGVTMIVLGAAGLLLGVIHMCAQDPRGKRKTNSDNEIAPPRIPKELPRIRGEPEEDDPDGALFYPECSVSPLRNRPMGKSDFGASPNREGALVVPTVGGQSMLSPYDQRSFPVPNIRSPNKSTVVIEAYSPSHTHHYDDGTRSGSVGGAAFKGQRLHGQLEKPHAAEMEWTRGNDPKYNPPSSPPRHHAVHFQQESPPPPIQETHTAMPAAASQDLRPRFDQGPARRDTDASVTMTNNTGAMMSRPLPVPSTGGGGRRFTDGASPDPKGHTLGVYDDDDMLSPDHWNGQY